MSADLTTEVDVQTATRDLAPILQAAGTMVIRSAEGYVQAGEGLLAIKKGLATIEEARVRITKPMNEALRAVNQQAKDSAAPLLAAEAAVKRALVAYDDEQQRIRREQQRQAEEAARRERERLESLRRAEEARAREQAEAARRAAEEAAAAGRTVEAAVLEHKAEEVVTRSEVRQETLVERKAETVAPVIAAAQPKVAGVAFKTLWKAEVTDLMELIKAVAAGRVPPTALQANTTVLGQMAKALKTDLNWPGVRVFEERGVAAGRG